MILSPNTFTSSWSWCLKLSQDCIWNISPGPEVYFKDITPEAVLWHRQQLQLYTFQQRQESLGTSIICPHDVSLTSYTTSNPSYQPHRKYLASSIYCDVNIGGTVESIILWTCCPQWSSTRWSPPEAKVEVAERVKIYSLILRYPDEFPPSCP
jgi:hypothetical protein